MTRATRHAVWAALSAGVLAVHLMLANQALDSQLGDGASTRGPRRIEVAFVSELKPTAPPPVVAAAEPRRPRARKAVVSATPAASAPDATQAALAASASASASAPSPAPPRDPPPSTEATETLASAVPPDRPASLPAAAPPEAPAVPAATMAASVPGTPPAALATAPAAVASASASDAFEWPRSTRLSYSVTGNFRGPVNGQARVEWLREGQRYQVHLEVAVGPAFAPLLSRRMSSDGVIGDDGLQPRRYDEETRAVLRQPRRQVLEFHDDRVVLANGQTAPRPPGVQDTASQFVQLTWLFRTRPQLLSRGQVVGIQLALPRYVDLWVYDVLGSEMVETAAGAIEAVHVRPRRPARARNDLTAEMWVAPSLQYLPVRFVIRQDEETYVDLLLERLPQQAGDGGAAPR